MTIKEDQSDAVKRSLTKAMIEEKYPSENWIHVYTDWSAKDAIKCKGVEMHIIFPNDETQDEAIPNRRVLLKL